MFSDSERFSKGREAYLAYVLEGTRNLKDWDLIVKYQRKNGSLFDSPATTAAAFTQFGNDGCLRYLCSLLQKFEAAGISISMTIISVVSREFHC